ncbi:hydrolase [Aquibacillus sediminis]|uniref:hydrolase n=1 Tax=Aquibacillus sediminis TaxID=2574734 RepID=UPI001108156D|nr:hydrolase [Aquibacillus sediminis]
MERKKYYVNVGTHEISQVQVGNNNDFTIYATDDEVYLLRQKLDEMHHDDIHAFWRAHVPIKPYHNDEENDAYDEDIISAFAMIRDLGDDKTKEHIESMEILDLE